MSRATLWPSPITPQRVAAGACLLAEPRVDAHALWWLQNLPAEGGRVTVMRLGADGAARALVPAPYSVGSRVNEYGGGAWTPAGDDALWFVNDADQALCRIDASGCRRVYRAEGVALGDLAWDPARRRVLAVAEARGGDRQWLLAVDGEGASCVLARGADFYAAPRCSPDGAELVWLEWSQPDMPWDATRLLRARLSADGTPGEPVRVAGGARESLAQPEWSPRGELYVVSDRGAGFWNLYRVTDSGLVAVRRVSAECARPAFVFGQRLYAFDAHGGLILAETCMGLWRCVEGREDGTAWRILLPELTEIAGVAAGPAGTAVLGGGAAEPLSLYFRARGAGAFRRVATSLDWPLDAGFVSRAEALELEVAPGAATHLLYFPPAQPRRASPGPPPLRLRCHGGPTSAASSALDPQTLYWTSRGFAVALLNYRGSTGYGRAYREALYGAWGVADVDDAVAAARGLAASGRADARRMVVAGGSAGGLTVLLALARADTPYAAGASYYGVTDLAALARDTHRFEAHYGEKLVGPWPAARALYERRSPLARAGDIARPAVFFQGLDDPVVPPPQSARMARALAARGLPVAYETFPGERHGFRRPETIARTLAVELAFYVRVLGLDGAEAAAEPRWLDGGCAPPMGAGRPVSGP